MVDAKRLYEVKSATLANFARLWENNFEANRSLIGRSPAVTSLFGRFKDEPAIIVGAGPSLDKNIRWLEPARQGAIIICVDTILQALSHAGIAPTFVVSLDPQPDIRSLYEGVDTTTLTLVAPTIAHPAALAAWKGRIVFYNKYAPDIPQLTRIANAAPDTGYLIPGGTVLSVGLDLAFRAGANPIAFCGQDLSYPPGPAYSKNTVYGDAAYDTLFSSRLGDMVEDTDIFGRAVPTLKSLFVTKQWMEWAFTTWKRGHPADYYNCTEGGIVTNHCAIATLEEFVVRFCARKKNYAWRLEKALKRKKR